MNVRNGFARTDPRNRDWRIEVVEEAKCRRRPNQFRSCNGIGTIRSDNPDIGIPQFPLSNFDDFIPRFMNPQRSAIDLPEIAMRSIVRHIAFEKNNVVSAIDQLPAQRPPDCRMTVAP